MQPIESRLSLSDDELDKLDPDPFMTVINKLIEVRNYYTKSHLYALNQFSNMLANIDADKPFKGNKKGRHVFFRSDKGIWISQVSLHGTKHYIKSSKDKNVVIKAYKEFCEIHQIVCNY